MSNKFTKLNSRYGLMNFPLTFSELKEAIKEFPKSERSYYETSFKAIKHLIKDNENIHYITTGDAKLLNTGGFVIVAESKLVLTFLKNSILTKAETETIMYEAIKNVDYDMIPINSSVMGGASLILEIGGLFGNKKKTINNIQETDIDHLVSAIKSKTGSNSSIVQAKKEKDIEKQEELQRFFGPNAGDKENLIMLTYGLAIGRIRDKFLANNETIISTVPVKYQVPGGKIVKGILVASDQKLIFSAETIFKEINEIFQYNDINDISIEEESLKDKKLHFTVNDKKVVYDIKKDVQLDRLLFKVQEHLENGQETSLSFVDQNEAIISETSVLKEETKGTNEIPSPNDKYQQLKQLAELKDLGILTEEEFQNEKIKVLNG